MKSHVTSIGVAFAIVAGVAVNSVFAQQAAVKRDFEGEVQAALEPIGKGSGAIPHMRRSRCRTPYMARVCSWLAF